MALFWALQESVEHVNFDRELGPLRGMYGSMDAEREVQRHHQEGGVDGILLPSQESYRPYQGALGQQRNL